MSADQSSMDLDVQFAFSRVVNGFLQLLGILVVMAQIKWQILLLVFPIAAACLLYQVLTILNSLMGGTPDWQDLPWPNRVTKMSRWDYESMNYESYFYDHWKLVLNNRLSRYFWGKILMLITPTKPICFANPYQPMIRERGKPFKCLPTLKNGGSKDFRGSSLSIIGEQ